MNDRTDPIVNASRRGFLLASAGMLVTACAGGRPAGVGIARASPQVTAAGANTTTAADSVVEPFHADHQGGIVTPAQAHTYFAALDLITDRRDDVINLFQRWTTAAARMSQGLPAADLTSDDQQPGADSADALGLSPARLTITFGFGTGLFLKDGVDRYRLSHQRPPAFQDLPNFPGDQLVPELSGGDLSLQACADDIQVAFHAVRQLARMAEGVAQIRWVQAGFIANFGHDATPRNLMGFKDGTGNPSVTDKSLMDKHVWVGSEAPAWLHGGSYVVARRSRIALEHWDRMNVAFQEQTIGRHKVSGAPIGALRETDQADLEGTDKDGNPLIPENSHLHLAHHLSNDGARILRRSYSFNNGVSVVAERWPPWHQGLEYDAGLLFVCYQRDPRSGFVKIFEQMSKFDMMNQFVTNVGSGLFACPGGIRAGEYLGQRMFADS